MHSRVNANINSKALTWTLYKNKIQSMSSTEYFMKLDGYDSYFEYIF